MKDIIIKDIETYVVDAEQNYVIVRIITNSEGLYGLGDSTLNGREPAVAAYISESLKPLLIGQPVINHNFLWERLYKAAYWVPGPVNMSALSGIDMALWDIRGKILEQPVWALLGGKFRDSIEVYTHLSGNTTEELISQSKALVKSGYTAIRLQMALENDNNTYTYGTTQSMPEGAPSVEIWDIDSYLERIPEMLVAVRKAVGNRIKLLHDSHERLSVSEAMKFSEKIKEVNLFFWEDAFRPETAFESYSLLRMNSTESISYGELFNRFDQMEKYLTNRLIDYLRVDLSHIGGITAALRASHMAQNHDVKMAFHGPPDLSPIGHFASWHVDLAIQNFGIQEFCPMKNQGIQDLFGSLPEPAGGRISLPDLYKPGLGCDFNIEAAKEYPYKQRFLPVAIRKDGTPIDW